MSRTRCRYCDGYVIIGTTCPKSLTCPLCKARPGERCTRPSGHAAAELHAPRVILAEERDRAAGIVLSFTT